MDNAQQKRLKVILIGALITGVGIGMFSNCMGVFIAPVCSAVGFSRGLFSLIGTVSILSSMFMLLWFGRILQAVAIKKIFFICALVCALVPLGYASCSGIWQFYALAAINGLAINGLTMVTVGVFIEQRLDGKHGMAMGVAFAGVGIVSSAMLPVLQFVIDQYGWRWGFRMQSAVGLLILMGTILFLVDNGKPLNKHQPLKEQAQSIPYEEAIITKSFQCLLIGLFCANFVNIALFNHAIPFLTDNGFTPIAAALISSVATLLMIASKPLYGLMLDWIGLRIGALLLGGVLFLGSVVALAFSYRKVDGLLYGVLLAGCACANALPGNIYAIRLFGKRDYPRIVARLTLASSAGAAAGTPLAGFVYDRFGSYQIIWVLCLVLSLFATALLYISASKNKLNSER